MNDRLKELEMRNNTERNEKSVQVQKSNDVESYSFPTQQMESFQTKFQMLSMDQRESSKNDQSRILHLEEQIQNIHAYYKDQISNIERNMSSRFSQNASIQVENQAAESNHVYGSIAELVGSNNNIQVQEQHPHMNLQQNNYEGTQSEYMVNQETQLTHHQKSLDTHTMSPTQSHGISTYVDGVTSTATNPAITSQTYLNQQMPLYPHSIIQTAQSFGTMRTHDYDSATQAPRILQPLGPSASGSLTFGEKQRLFDHIHHLETIQQDVQEHMKRLERENKILTKFRYLHVLEDGTSDEIAKLLPKLFEDETFTLFGRLSHILNRCLKKCFQDGQVFQQGYHGHQNQFQVDTGVLVQYIEKMVQQLQSIERYLNKYKVIDKKSHLGIIEIIQEGCLQLSQIPELYSANVDQQKESQLLKVFQQILYWKTTVELHVDFMIQEKKNQIEQKKREEQQQQSQNSMTEDTLQDENDDEFWSDFSDNYFEMDQSQERDQLDILYNLQTWIISNSDLDFIKFFKPFAEMDQGNTHHNLITCQNFMIALQSAGYDYCDISLKSQTDFMCLIRTMSFTQKQTILSVPQSHKNVNQVPSGFINFKQFLDDIREKPYKWWQQQLLMFLQEIQDTGDLIHQDVRPANRDNSYINDINRITKYFPKPGSQFEQFCEKIVINRISCQKSPFENIFDSHKDHLSKVSLRRFILSQEMGLSRLDCHLLVKIIYRMNKNELKVEQDAAKRKELKTRVDRINITQLQKVVQNSQMQSYKRRCEQMMQQSKQVI